MARARNIKPGFFHNADLVELPFEARLLFIGLWTLADRAGRLEDRPRQIKMALFPADAVDVEACLDGLQRWGFVKRYEVGGKRLIQVVNFTKHQNPHRDEKASELPPEHDANTVQARCEDSAGTVPIGLNPESGFLNPDPRPLTPEHPLPLGDASGGVAASFEDFWQAYPRKEGRLEAMKAFEKVKAEPGRVVDALMQALQRQKAGVPWRREGGRYVPHAATWLNGRRWEDELGAARAGPAEDDARPAWALAAGFANRYEAENARCYEHNHHTFADGRRLETV